MPMIPFFQRFPEIASRETRTVHLRSYKDVPDGEYGFLEFYCDEPDCDCRRVLIWVMSPTSGRKVWASINYGWESEEFYIKWAHKSYDGLKGPELDPINPQSPYAGVFLEFFKLYIEDEKYIDRLKRHYKMMREGL